MNVSQLRPAGGDPYELTFAQVAEAQSELAITDLVRALYEGRVRIDSLREIVLGASVRNVRPAIPQHVVETYIDRQLLLLARERRKAEETRKERAERGLTDPDLIPAELAFRAVAVLVRCTWSAFMFDAGADELEVCWNSDGATGRLPISDDPRALQRAVSGRLGSLDTFVARAHAKAKKLMVLRALQDLARRVPKTTTTNERNLSVQLVESILALQLWTEREVSAGEFKPCKVTLGTSPGVHPEVGLARVQRSAEGTDEVIEDLLYVGPHALANNSRNLAGSFRTKTALELIALLDSAPGSRGVERPRNLRKTMGDVRYRCIDLLQFARHMRASEIENTVPTVPGVPSAQNVLLFPGGVNTTAGPPRRPRPSPPSPGTLGTQQPDTVPTFDPENDGRTASGDAGDAGDAQ